MPVDHQWAPNDTDPAPVSTEAFVTFDEEYLYVGFRAHDPEPAKIRARFADRDVAFGDDTVGFFLDPFNDRRRALQFRINPLGVQMDAVSSDIEGIEDWSFDIIWESAGRLTGDGYEVEVAIPFRQLRFPRTQGPQTWGFMAMRDYPRSLRHRMRSIVTDQDRNCLVCQIETLTGFSGMETGRNLEVVPTLTAVGREARTAFPDGDFATVDETAEPGISARWGVTPNIYLNATVNPDFSQVEADAAQLDVNTRFALFFPEKRPFFLEGSDYFDTLLPLVFTRTVADPVAGVKLTGREGPNGFGIFFAEDRINNLIFPGAQGSALGSIDDDVSTGVVRYRRDLGEASSLGLLYAGRVGDDYDNHVLGIDGLYRFSDSDLLRYQVVGTRSDYPDPLAAEHGQPIAGFGGHSVVLDYVHSDRDWFWFANFEETDRDFRADSGFIPQVGVREGGAGIQRRFRGSEDDWYSNIFLFAAVYGTREQEGVFDEWSGDLVAIYTGPKQSEISLGISPNREHFDGVDYENTRYSLSGEIQPTGNVELEMRVRWGETIDFAGNRPADFLTLSPEIEIELRRFQAEVRYDRQDLDVAGGRLFRLGLLQTRAIFHFGRRTFVRAILQHRSLDRDPSLFPFPVEPEESRLLTQLLFSYRLNAQTALLAGYSDNHLGLADVSLTRTDRTVFVKLSYAWLG